jgi:hypothetical protein
MRSWLNWTHVIRAAGLFAMGLGVFWHEGALVIAGLGVIGAPTVFGGKEPR